MKCPKCGNEFNSKFCFTCGYKAEDEVVTSQEIHRNSFQQQQAVPQTVQVKTFKKSNLGLIIGLSIAGAVILLVIIGVVLYGTVFKGKNQISKPGTSSDVKNIGLPLSDEEIKEMYSNPGKFKGRTVTLTGKIFSEPTYSTEKLEFNIFADPKNSEKHTIISYDNTSVQLKKGDFVSVTGIVDKSAKPQNADEEVVSTVPRIKAESLTSGTYDKIIDPTIREAVVQIPWQAQYGYIIQINKIELGKTETRVHVKLQNNGIDNFNVYPLTAKLVQNSNQYSCEPNHIANYPSLESTLLPDAQSEGVITFPPISQTDFKIVFNTYVGDNSIVLKPFEFQVLVK